MGKRKKSGQKRKPQPSELVKLIRTPTGSTFDCPRCSGKDTLEIKIKATHSDGKKGKTGRELFSLTARTTINANILCKNCGEKRTISRLLKTDAPIDVYYKYMTQLDKEKKKRREEAEEDYDEEDGYEEEKLEEDDYDDEEHAEEPRKKVSKKNPHSDDEDEDDDEDDEADGSDLFGDDE